MRKILAGERSFKGVRLEDYFDEAQSGNFDAVNEYLKKQDFKKGPLAICGSEMKGVCLRWLCLPYLDVKDSLLESACFDNCIRANAYFTRVRMEYAKIRDASVDGLVLAGADTGFIEFTHSTALSGDYSNANLEEAVFLHTGARFSNFENAVLKKAKMRNANISHSRMKGANILASELDFAERMHVKDFMLCKGIETARFKEAEVTERLHKEIIERLKDENMRKQVNIFRIDYSSC